MPTLTDAINATETVLTVSNPAQGLERGDLFRIDDEVLRFLRYGRAAGPTWSPPSAPIYSEWHVVRAQSGSTAASHAQGANIQAAVDAFLAGTFTEPPSPFDTGTGGGGITFEEHDVQSHAGVPGVPLPVVVDNTVDDPTEVTTIVAPGATVEAGVATLVEGVQRVRLLGPYRVNFDDAGVVA